MIRKKYLKQQVETPKKMEYLFVIYSISKIKYDLQYFDTSLAGRKKVHPWLCILF